MLPAAALQSKAKFKELRQEHLDLSSNMACSLHSRWPAGGGPEFVVVGKCILFNKTGLPLVVRESDAAAPVGGLAPGKVAVLRAEVEVRAGVGKVKACDATPGKMTLPTCTETLGLRVTAAAHETSKIFNWIEHQVTLKDGSLRLGFANGATPCAVWPLSTHSTVSATEPTLAAGEKDCFTVEDPGRGQRLLLRAPSRKAQGEWIFHIRETVAALKAEDISGPDGSALHVTSRDSIVVVEAVSAASWLRSREDEASIAAGWDDSHGEGLFNAWCSDGIPVQVPGSGEFIITAGTPQAPLAMFLGVQVHPLMGLFTQSKGVTVTPRFVIRNASASYVQVLPALLPPNEENWPQVPSRSAAIVEEHAGRMLSITDFIAQDEEKEAMWVPPGASLALFHFPTRCQASELRKGAKAVALRLPGPPLLEMISVKYKLPLQLDRVSTGGFLPYRDKLVQLGRLPQSLRILAKEGRLLCLRGEYLKDFESGQVVLSRPAEIWIGLPKTDTVEPASWLLTDWTKAEVVDLRRRQRSEVSLQLYTRHVEAGVLNLNGAGVGCVVFLARSKSEDPGVEMAALGEAAGLPWSRWLSLNSTCESVISLRSGTDADEPSVRWARKSRKAMQPVSIPFDDSWPDTLRDACSVAGTVVRDAQGRSLPQDAPGQLQRNPGKAQFPLSVEAGGDAGFTGEGQGAGYRQPGQDLAEAADLSRAASRMVARFAGTPIQAFITTDEKGSTVDFGLLSGDRLFSLRQPLASDAMLKDLEVAVASALGLRLNIVSAFSQRDPSNPIEKSCDLKEYNGESLVLTFYDDFGDCRRFLKAMTAEAFNPRSEGFHVKWTLKAFARKPEVRAGEVLDLLQSDKHGPEVPEGMVREFMQIFGRLTSMAEKWNHFHLELLQNFDPGTKTLKHHLCQHWLQLAKDSVTQKVPPRPPPVILLCWNERAAVRGMDLFTVDGSFPEMFPRNLQNSLRLSDVDGRSQRSMLMIASLNADWFTGLPWKELCAPHPINKSRLGQWAEKCEEAVKKDKEMKQGEPLERDDVVRMMHVQLRLSCRFRVVEVEGELHMPLLRCAAALLQWHLKEVTQGVGGLELEHVLKGLLADAKKEVQPGMRGVLILVWLSSSHAPDDLKLCWSQNSVRFILCYPEGAKRQRLSTHYPEWTFARQWLSLARGSSARTVNFLRCSVQVLNSTAFMMLSDEPPPYRVENWSPTRTLAVTFRGVRPCQNFFSWSRLTPLTWCAFDWPVRSKADRDRRLVLQDLVTHRKEMYEVHKGKSISET
ncbi:unnamed protein product [Symbiodinium sp. CCMP2456]|nr:unnamed protein product [Symbiodinium sp. CCMP2456]